MSNYPLYDKVCDYNLLKQSYKKAQKGKRKYNKDSIIFDMARERNLVNLWRELKNQTYKPSNYIRFTINKPKERIINAPCIRDKIVQHSVHMVLKEIYGPVYVKSTYACLDGRGTHKAVDKVQHNMRLQKWQNQENKMPDNGWIIKIDISKFFYSIPHDILKKILDQKIKYDPKFRNLVHVIIDSSPEGKKIGIPLGNVSSQDFANIDMNKVDQYVMRYLGEKLYVRYMDDIVIVVPTRNEAVETLQKIKWFVEEKMNLKFNQKTKIFPIDQGVNAFGFKIFTTHKLVRNKSKTAMKKRIKAMDRKVQNGEMSKEEVQQSVNSWLGHARHSNSYNLSKKIFSKYNYIEIENPKFKFGQRSTHY